jgi:tyrosine-protein phosphatase SIW14
MIRTLILFSIFAGSLALAEPRIRPAEWATPVIGTELENIYQVDEGLYRSEQPDEEDFALLSKYGIAEVLNLRENNSDESEAEGVSLKLHRVQMDTDEVSENEILRALAVIQRREGPILVHCWHGSDRTGATIAAYRLVFNGWSKEKALDEMNNGGYGYHASIFPNLVELIENLDVEKIRKKLKMPVEKSVINEKGE